MFSKATVGAFDRLHCKNICIFTDSLWRVFYILTEPVPYTFVSVNRWNFEASAQVPGLHYSVDLRIQTYTEPVSFLCGKLATKYPWYTDIFTVQADILTFSCTSVKPCLLRVLLKLPLIMMTTC